MFLFFFHEQLIKKKTIQIILYCYINIFNLSENILFEESLQNLIH